jgi:hypothetical protein
LLLPHTLSRKERDCPMKKSEPIKVIVENPPTKEHVEKKLREVSEFLSKELSRKPHNKGIY